MTQYLIWSNEHAAFWRPNSRGYTQSSDQAGRYSEDEARGICRGANYRAWSDLPKDVPPEIMLPAPDTAAELERVKAELRQVKNDKWDLLCATRELLSAYRSIMSSEFDFPSDAWEDRPDDPRDMVVKVIARIEGKS